MRARLPLTLAALIAFVALAATVALAVYFASVDHSTTEDAVRDALLASLVVAGLVALAALAFGWWLTRRLRRLRGVAQAMAEGDLSYRAPIDADDEVGRLAQAINDALARLRATAEAASEEGRELTAVLGNMADGVVITDATARVLLLNAAAARLFEIAEAAASGRPFIEVCRDHELADTLADALAQGQARSAVIESTAPRQYLRIVASPITGGGRAAAVVVLQDLTELRRLETVRKDFVANISHELRTPLASIKAVLETLQDGALEDQAVARDFLARMDDEVDQLTQLVQQLLELSRLESGQAPLQIEPLDVGDVLGEIAGRMSSQAERAGVTLGLAVPDGLPPAPADRRRLREAVVNLVHNAIKYTPSGGSVTLAAAAEGGELRISVRDTGVGIAHDQQARIFERFFKSDSARSSEGVGLGLAIVKNVALAHGGRVTVDSREGAGATFTIVLPLERTAPV
jgi:two-component system phosphate regulon sensor histidine kinase PhoR